MEKDVETHIVPIFNMTGSHHNSSNDICGNGENMMDVSKSSLLASINNELNIDINNSQNTEQQTINLMNRTINNNNNSHKDSLTHSQISMISKEDHGSHLYSTPESIMASDEKPIVSGMSSHNDDHDNDNDDRKSTHTTKMELTKQPITPTNTTSPGMMMMNTINRADQKPKSTFPTHILLGALQLVLSVCLAALGGLVIARNAALCMAFSGIWAGAIAGITGSLAILNVRGAKTGFLAASLISVASGTLAASLTGIGLLRDWNIVHQDEVNYY
uniref:CSON012799 protein n=1 Tax=Culicoides sonorensis TaxID=179676 RepID=A0A336MII1_CULSO